MEILADRENDAFTRKKSMNFLQIGNYLHIIDMRAGFIIYFKVGKEAAKHE